MDNIGIRGIKFDPGESPSRGSSHGRAIAACSAAGRVPRQSRPRPFRPRATPGSSEWLDAEPDRLGEYRPAAGLVAVDVEPSPGAGAGQRVTVHMGLMLGLDFAVV